MILSMTGFAARQLELPHGTLTIELRAVNHRYLDIQLRMPEDLRTFEPLIRETFAGKVLRGKIECRINFNSHQGASSSLQLNQTLLQQLLALAKEVQQYAPHAGNLRMGELLRWPGILVNDAFPLDTLQARILSLTQTALADFIASREREGIKLALLLIERVEKMEVLMADIRPRIPSMVAQYEEKLKHRFLDAMQTLDDGRILQEIGLFAQKIDIEEELGRLAMHLSEVRRVLKDKEQGAGKHLDFLMQELNREANTLGAKSASADISRLSIELKIYIEQMREQVQNIE